MKERQPLPLSRFLSLVIAYLCRVPQVNNRNCITNVCVRRSRYLLYPRLVHSLPDWLWDQQSLGFTLLPAQISQPPVGHEFLPCEYFAHLQGERHAWIELLLATPLCGNVIRRTNNTERMVYNILGQGKERICTAFLTAALGIPPLSPPFTPPRRPTDRKSLPLQL